MKFNIEEFEWEYADFVFIVCVLLAMFASLIEDICNYIGLDNVELIIIAFKGISAFLGFVYAVWKFLRLKPKRFKIFPDDWVVAEIDKGVEFKKFYPKSLHKKGKKPLYQIDIKNEDGTYSEVDIENSVDSDGGINIKGKANKLPENEFMLTIRALS
jgi:hypothetical protein